MVNKGPCNPSTNRKDCLRIDLPKLRSSLISQSLTLSFIMSRRNSVAYKLNFVEGIGNVLEFF